jgi:hypothetical protein
MLARALFRGGRPRAILSGNARGWTMRTHWVRTTMLVMTLGFGAIAFAPKSTSDDEGRRGCCSHHGGVCGCAGDAHALKCCDGELSPTCGC